MLALNQLLPSVTFLLILATYFRSTANLLHLLSNMRWIKDKNRIYMKRGFPITSEKYIICIPMLREQRIVSKTLRYFSRLHYPRDKYHIVIVTTTKEITEKIRDSKQLNVLAKDISLGKSFDMIRSKYLGLFPLGNLEAIHRDYQHKDYLAVLKKIKSVYQKLPTTFELATKEAATINARLKSTLTTVMNYPYNLGVMSHQLNYVLRKLGKDKKNVNSIFAVYNADSRPNPNTLQYVTLALKEFEEETNVKPNIVQQSSLFTLNYNRYPTTFIGYSLKAAALFQTKWTLVRELTRFRIQSRSVIAYEDNAILRLFNTRISHCVGHGLFVRFRVLKNEYLPTETINEDLPFGFYQCCKGEPILPLPILENSETPDTLKALLNQKRFWFSPYLQYLSCRDRVLKSKQYRSRLEVELLTIQAELTGIIWLLQSIVLFMPLIIGLYLHSLPIIILWTIGMLLYWFIPIGLIYANLSRLEYLTGKSVSKTNFLDYVLTSFSGLYIILTHSIGPFLCLRDFVLLKFTNKPILKLKTER